MKILYFDCETTGTDPIEQDITQISGMIEVDGKIEEKFNFRCQPINWEGISPEALQVTGISIEELKTNPTPQQTYNKLVALFSKYVDKYDRNDKFYPAGYNVRFDLEFLQSFFIKQGDKFGSGSWQNWRAIDALPIVHFLDFTGRLRLPNYKLSTVCDYYGISIKAHDAMSDIEATRALIYTLADLINGGPTGEDKHPESVIL
jgi:DNA polymerase III epsilon subunit-like protein